MKTKYIATVLLLFSTICFSSSIPEFSLKKLDGSTFSISEVLGKKVILIDFWATWCKPCKKLLKKLNKINKDYKSNVIVLAISTDKSSAFSRIESYIKSRNYSFTVLLDPDSSVSGLFNPSDAIPFTMIVDKEKNIVFTHTGYIPGFEKELREKIIEIIGK